MGAGGRLKGRMACFKTTVSFINVLFMLLGAGIIAAGVVVQT